jgi:hypothetical protein
MRGSVALGFDSYSENYSVIQVPTLTRLNEFRTRLTLGYLHGSFLTDHVLVEARSLIGQESLDTAGRASFARRFGATRFLFDNTATFRSYREGTVYTFANDFLRYDLRAALTRQIASGLSIGLIDRLEVIDFDQRTEFDYDYVRNGVEVAVNYDRGFTSGYQATFGYTGKIVPDSTGISYDALTGGLEYRHTSGLHRQLFVAIDGERRVYQDVMTRSPFWSAYSNANIQPLALGSFGITIENEFESYTYDQSTAVFFNYVENRTSLRFTYFNSSLFTVGVGPTYGFLRSDASPVDEYREIGARLSVDATGKRLWLSASYEPGRRDYRVDPVSDADLVFSDFVYHRVLLFATFRLVRNANLNVFANLEPEDHKLEDDDTTMTILSADITYGF